MKNTRLEIGKNTKGIDGKTVSYYEKIPAEKLIQLVKRRFNNFTPMKIRRIFYFKIQRQATSFDFRSLRSTKHSVNKMILILQMTKYEYCIDVDIKDFFDNVDHAILIEQLHKLGICDKKLLTIISKMLKTDVENESIKKVGLIQGGILSSLLSNVVLNELD